jgi:hypothetical protein
MLAIEGRGVRPGGVVHGRGVGGEEWRYGMGGIGN